MSKSPFVVNSERNLLRIHNDMTTKIKSFKRLFIKRGLMMRTFDNINRLHQAGDYSGISRMVSQLHSEIPPHWTPRHSKYLELIHYCCFLEFYRNRDDNEEAAIIAEDLISTLNMGHELGRAIEKRVKLILHS